MWNKVPDFSFPSIYTVIENYNIVIRSEVYVKKVQRVRSSNIHAENNMTSLLSIERFMGLVLFLDEIEKKNRKENYGSRES